MLYHMKQQCEHEPRIGENVYGSVGITLFEGTVLAFT